MSLEDKDRIAATPFQMACEGKLLVGDSKGASLSDLYRVFNLQTIHITRLHGKTKSRIDCMFVSVL